MKLAIIGGGGVRTPLLVRGILKRLPQLPIRQVSLFDVDQERLELIGSVVQELVAEAGRGPALEFTTNPDLAMSGADFVLCSIRVGNEEARVADERIPLKYQVLGQETTGPGGFAMALRTIPVVADYAQRVAQLAPGAWFINFTNPAGLVAQAMAMRGLPRFIGICDGPGALYRSVAHHLGTSSHELRFNYFGLNHLGWVKAVEHQGKDVLGELIDQAEALVKQEGLKMFPPDLLRSLSLLPNEYLYYFYFRREAVANILQAGRTRGEQVAELSRHLFTSLRQAKRNPEPGAALRIYQNYIGTRHGSYMKAETGQRIAPTPPPESEEGSGYDEVALGVVQAISRDQGRIMTLNVPNQGAMRELSSDDVVEVPCVVDRNGPTPLAVGDVPRAPLGLIQQVKAFERLTAQAALEGSYRSALAGLAAHPLVPSYSIAKSILNDYLQAHHRWIPWS
ncbi:MAG: 6-phospho-beta-glucosidase [Deinococcus sp.]|nr:6-phospho-beta-glucosidase [Deinococcus sp.]